MRLSLMLCIVTSMLCLLGRPQQSFAPCSASLAEPTALTYVEGALKLTKGGPFALTYEKILDQLGDSAAIAILKLVEPKDLIEPETTQACLVVMAVSFSSPRLISREIDKDPKVTLFLLGYLLERVGDGELKSRIQATKEYVETQTKHLTQHPK